MIKIKSDKIINNGSLYSGYIYVDGEKIIGLSQTDTYDCQTYDFTGKYVSAGFIDLHTHGAGGFDFLTDDENEVINGVNYLLQFGATSVLPTISTASYSRMDQAVKTIKKAKQSEKIKTNLIGAHLEGPYLSKSQCGAQNTSNLTVPIKKDYEKIIDDYGSAIARWTYAPELDESGEFCDYIVRHGIVASAGHTDANYNQVRTAVAKGMNVITHLYSATSSVTRKNGFRQIGVIESAFLIDDLYVEIIADGKHLPTELINLIIKIKGVDKVALVTDSLSITDTDAKHGEMNGIEYIVEEGVCKLKDRTAFAGSVAKANDLIRTIIDCGLSVPLAVKMLTEVPAKILKLKKGKLEKGYDADIIIFDDQINVSNAFVLGEKIF